MDITVVNSFILITFFIVNTTIGSHIIIINITMEYTMKIKVYSKTGAEAKHTAMIVLESNDVVVQLSR